MKKIIATTLFICTICFGVFAQNKQGNLDISVGIGAPTVTEISATILSGIGKAVTLQPLNKDNTQSKFGAITLGAKFSVTDKFKVGGDLVFESFENGLFNNLSVFSIMPRADYLWINNSVFRLYSGVAVGLGVANSSGQNSESSTGFIFNVAPLGIEAGKKLSFYAELGFGASGLAVGGVRLRL